MTSSGTDAQYAIVGAGALGSILGAHLAKAGHEVALLARGPRAQRIVEQGLRIEGLADSSVSVPVIVEPARLRSARTLIIATKAPGTRQLLHSLRHVKVDSAFCVQNGVHKNDLLAEAFGRDRTLGALADVSGELRPDGVVLFTRNVNLLLGELDGGMSERCDRLAREIDTAGVRCRAVADIVTLEWSKFVAWVGFTLIALLTRAETWKFLQDADCATLFARTIVEMRTLATAAGVDVSDESIFPVRTLGSMQEREAVELLRAAGRKYRDAAPAHRTSALQDLEAGRPLEIHEIIGHALQRAAELNVPLPLVEGLYRLAAGNERIAGADRLGPRDQVPQNVR